MDIDKKTDKVAPTKEICSYPTEEMQLKMRIEDLLIRLEEIETEEYGLNAKKYMDCRYQKDYLEVAPIEYLFSTDDIIYALSKAVEQLLALSTNDDNSRSLTRQMSIWDYMGNEVNDIKISQAA